jgi:hypothetical protein
MGGFLVQIRKVLFGDEAKLLALVYSSLTRQGLTSMRRLRKPRLERGR